MARVRNEMAVRFGHCKPAFTALLGQPALEIPVSAEEQADFDASFDS
jgi:hypothetical protein